MAWGCIVVTLEWWCVRKASVGGQGLFEYMDVAAAAGFSLSAFRPWLGGWISAILNPTTQEHHWLFRIKEKECCWSCFSHLCKIQAASCSNCLRSNFKITVDDWVVASCHLHYGPYWGRCHQMRTSVTLTVIPSASHLRSIFLVALIVPPHFTRFRHAWSDVENSKCVVPPTPPYIYKF